tara:strand:+ start:225 stop:1544 length:1320 start_codon:yes stop_codon:yes gene_type:complete
MAASHPISESPSKITFVTTRTMVWLFMMVFITLAGASAPAQAAKYAAIVIEEHSGRVLFARNADSLRYPASLTKIMTLYLVFEDIAAGRLKLKSRIPVSKIAAGRSPSKLYLKPGQSISTEQAIYALVTKSANDVATAVAEKLGGSERAFAKRMTRKARALGMSRTTFRNASGLPHSKQRSTARDMARLAIAMRRDFPQYFKYFSAKSFNWNGRKFSNHNKLLSKFNGTDGIKTGYINASGFNLVATVTRNNVRLIGVVFGGKTSRSRDTHMMDILERQFKRIKPAQARQQLAALPKKLPTSAPTRVNDIPEAIPRPKQITVKRLADTIVADNTPEFLDIATTAASLKVATDDQPHWSVQIGNFAQRINAHKAAIRARRMADKVLGMTPANLTLVTRGEMPLWRVRFNDLDESQARSACAALFAKGSPCIAVRATTSKG